MLNISTTFKLTTGSILLGGGLHAADVLYNYTGTTDVQFSGGGNASVVYGTILAPNATIGLQWGIFFALLAAGILAWTGARVRAAHRPEPPLRPRQPEPPPGAPVEVHIPEERPHLDETRVMPSREPPTEEAEAPTPERPTPARPDPSDQQHLPGMG